MTSPSAGRGQTREERPTLDDDIARARRNWKVFGDVQSASALRLADAVADLRSRLAAAEADAAREFESGNDWCQRALAAEAELDALRDGIQALADEWDGTAAAIPPGQPNPAGRRDSLRDCSASLRSLLSPANPQKDEQP